MFTGYEYEDWLLTQWGLWNHGGIGCPTCKTGFGGSSDRINCEINDDMAMTVDRALLQMELHDRRLLKKFYVHASPDCNIELVRSAVRQFAVAYEAPRRRIA